MRLYENKPAINLSSLTELSEYITKHPHRNSLIIADGAAKQLCSLKTLKQKQLQSQQLDKPLLKQLKRVLKIEFSVGAHYYFTEEKVKHLRAFYQLAVSCFQKGKVNRLQPWYEIDLLHELVNYEVYINVNLPQAYKFHKQLAGKINAARDIEQKIRYLYFADYYSLAAVLSFYRCKYSEAKDFFDKAGDHYQRCEANASHDEIKKLRERRVINRLDQIMMLRTLQMRYEMFENTKKASLLLESLNNKPVSLYAIVRAFYLKYEFAEGAINSLEVVNAMNEQYALIQEEQTKARMIFSELHVQTLHQHFGTMTIEMEKQLDIIQRLSLAICGQDHFEYSRILSLKLWYTLQASANTTKWKECDTGSIRLFAETFLRNGFTSNNSHHLIAIQHYLSGSFYTITRNYRDAHARLSIAYEIFSSLRDTCFDAKNWLGPLSNLLGEISKDIGDFVTARDHYERSILGYAETYFEEAQKQLLGYRIKDSAPSSNFKKSDGNSHHQQAIHLIERIKWLFHNVVFSDEQRQNDFFKLHQCAQSLLTTHQITSHRSGALVILSAGCAEDLNNLAELDMLSLSNLPSSETKLRHTVYSLGNSQTTRKTNLILAELNLLKCQFYMGNYEGLLTKPTNHLQMLSGSFSTDDNYIIMRICHDYTLILTAIGDLPKAREFVLRGLEILNDAKSTDDEKEDAATILSSHSRAYNYAQTEIISCEQALLLSRLALLEMIEGHIKHSIDYFSQVLNYLESYIANNDKIIPDILQIQLNILQFFYCRSLQRFQDNSLVSTLSINRLLPENDRSSLKSTNQILLTAIYSLIHTIEVQYNNFLRPLLIDAYILRAKVSYCSDQKNIAKTGYNQTILRLFEFLEEDSGIPISFQAKGVREMVLNYHLEDSKRKLIPNISAIEHAISRSYSKYKSLPPRTRAAKVFELLNEETADDLSPIQAHFFDAISHFYTKETWLGNIRAELHFLRARYTRKFLPKIKNGFTQDFKAFSQASDFTMSNEISRGEEILKANNIWGLVKFDKLVNFLEQGFHDKTKSITLPGSEEIIKHYQSIVDDALVSNDKKWLAHGIIIALSIVSSSFQLTKKYLINYQNIYRNTNEVDDLFMSLLFLSAFVPTNLENVIKDYTLIIPTITDSAPRNKYLKGSLLHNLACLRQISALHKKMLSSDDTWINGVHMAEKELLESIKISDLSSTKCELVNHLLLRSNLKSSSEDWLLKLRKFELTEPQVVTDSTVSYSHIEKPMLVHPLQYIIELHGPIRVSTRALHYYLLIMLYWPQKNEQNSQDRKIKFGIYKEAFKQYVDDKITNQKESTTTHTASYLYVDILQRETHDSVSSYIDFTASSYKAAYNRSCPYIDDDEKKMARPPFLQSGWQNTSAGMLLTPPEPAEELHAMSSPSSMRRSSRALNTDAIGQKIYAAVNKSLLKKFTWLLKWDEQRCIVRIFLTGSHLPLQIQLELLLELIQLLLKTCEVEPWLTEAKLEKYNAAFFRLGQLGKKVSQHDFRLIINHLSKNLVNDIPYRIDRDPLPNLATNLRLPQPMPMLPETTLFSQFLTTNPSPTSPISIGLTPRKSSLAATPPAMF